MIGSNWERKLVRMGAAVCWGRGGGGGGGALRDETKTAVRETTCVGPGKKMNKNLREDFQQFCYKTSQQTIQTAYKF